MKSTNRITLKRNQDTGFLEITKQESEFNELTLTRNEAGIYTINGFEQDVENKIFVISDSHTVETNTDEINTVVSTNEVDGEIIILCENNGSFVDGISLLYILIELDVDVEYTPQELSEIYHACSILTRGGNPKLVELASKIGFPRPRPNQS